MSRYEQNPPLMVQRFNQLIQAILATQFDDFDKGPIFRDQFGSLLGSGVFNADGSRFFIYINTES